MRAQSEAGTGPVPAAGEFADIYERHFTEIHRYIAGRLGRDVADDIAADTFVIALRKRDGFDPMRGTVRAWLYGIATNLVARQQRAEQRRYRALARAGAWDLADGPEERVVSWVAAGAAAALAFVTLVPHGAPAARPGHVQAGGLVGRPARGFLLTMAVKAAAASPSTGRWYCQQMEEGGRELVGANDTTLQAPWDQGPPASLAGYQYAIFGKHMTQSCFEPPTKGAPYGTVEGATQSLGAQPVSPADAAAWRRDGSPTSWIAWYGGPTTRITMAPGRRYLAGRRKLTVPRLNLATLPTSPARLKAYILAHDGNGNTGTQSEVLYDVAITFMNGQSPPALRAAAYRLLASLPGIRMRPNVQDPVGQSGTAVWLPQAGPTLGMEIVDPATGTWLGAEDVAQRAIPAAHVAVGTVVDYTLFTGFGWTNTPPGS